MRNAKNQTNIFLSIANQMFLKTPLFLVDNQIIIVTYWIIVYNWGYFTFIGPWSIFKILFSKFGKCILIQVGDLVGHTLRDHITEIDKEFFNLK